ncbi:MAG: serine protease [Lachnospiraceae bacterium]|nr:serine protease [Lachnospiraceae bacterium]
MRSFREEEFYYCYEELNIERGSTDFLRIVIAMALFIFAAGISASFLLYPFMVYRRAQDLSDRGYYDAAVSDFRDIMYYRDSPAQIVRCIYEKGRALYKNGDYQGAEKIFLSLSGNSYRDSLRLLLQSRYRIAEECLKAGEYREASGRFLALKDYHDSHAKYLEAVYQLIFEEYGAGRVTEALSMLPVFIEEGYFSGSVLEEGDHEAALPLARKTSLNLYADLSDSPGEWSDYTGSACIYRVTPSRICCLSAAHVLKVLSGHQTELTFFDGGVCEALIEPVFTDDPESDLGMFFVPTASVPIETLMTLKEICFDPSYLEDLSPNEPAFIYSADWYHKRPYTGDPSEDLIGETAFLGFDTYAMTDGCYDNGRFLVFARASKEGQSGSPVFDDRGRCIALASSYYYRQQGESVVYEVDCHCRLEAAEELFKSMEI